VAETIVNAHIPELNVNFAPDIYNGLVCIKEVLVSVGAEEELLQLKREKD
jgi:hypothetical protein